ncbi:MAG: Hsp20/alpha crystallin family protein [Acidimicrobiales bacterium]
MLMRFDPLRELDRLVQQTNDVARLPVMAMDAYRHDDRFVVHFDVPGVDPSSIELTVEKNVLTVSAERRWEPVEGDQVLVSERPQGSFSRQLFLGESLDADRIEASQDHGVLTVSIPVAEQAKPRRVEISDGGGKARAIDAPSSAA